MVEIDMLGTDKEPLRTEPTKVAKGKAVLSFSKEYRAAVGSKLASKYLEALDSEETEDSEVQLVVLACDNAGKELGEVGTAACSLEELLKRGKDHTGPLPIKRADGSSAQESPLVRAALSASTGRGARTLVEVLRWLRDSVGAELKAGRPYRQIRSAVCSRLAHSVDDAEVCARALDVWPAAARRGKD